MLVFILRHIPLPRKFYAINLFGVVLSREHLNRVEYNHEYIHSLQQREMLYVFFYIWYVVEWGIRLIQFRNPLKAYYHISFEREAYTHQYDYDYRHHRRHFSWFRFIH